MLNRIIVPWGILAICSISLGLTTQAQAQSSSAVGYLTPADEVLMGYPIQGVELARIFPNGLPVRFFDVIGATRDSLIISACQLDEISCDWRTELVVPIGTIRDFTILREPGSSGRAWIVVLAEDSGGPDTILELVALRNHGAVFQGRYAPFELRRFPLPNVLAEIDFQQIKNVWLDRRVQINQREQGVLIAGPGGHWASFRILDLSGDLIASGRIISEAPLQFRGTDRIFRPDFIAFGAGCISLGFEAGELVEQSPVDACSEYLTSSGAASSISVTNQICDQGDCVFGLSDGFVGVTNTNSAPLQANVVAGEPFDWLVEPYLVGQRLSPIITRRSDTYVFIDGTQGVGLSSIPFQPLPGTSRLAGGRSMQESGGFSSVWLTSNPPDGITHWVWREPPIRTPATVGFQGGASAGSVASLGVFPPGRLGAAILTQPAAPQSFGAQLRFVPPDGSPPEQVNVPVLWGQRVTRTAFGTSNQATGTWTVELTGVQGLNPNELDVSLGVNTTAYLEVRDDVLPPNTCAVACLMLLNDASCGVGPRREGKADGLQGEPPSPPSPAAMGTLQEVALLRRLRDEVLASSPGGQQLIEVYQSLQPALFRAVLAEPRFYVEVAGLKTSWMWAVENLVEGSGTARIDRWMELSLNNVLQKLWFYGDESLRRAIDRERQRLGLTDTRVLQSTTIGALRQRWEQAPLFVDGFEP